MWPFGNKDYDSSAEGGAMSGPQLPSTGAMQDGMTADPLQLQRPAVANPYDQTNMGARPPMPIRARRISGRPTGNPYAAPAAASAAACPAMAAIRYCGGCAATGPYNPNYGQPPADPAATAIAGRGCAYAAARRRSRMPRRLPTLPATDRDAQAATGAPAGTTLCRATPPAAAHRRIRQCRQAPPARSGPVVTNPYATAGATANPAAMQRHGPARSLRCRRSRGKPSLPLSSTAAAAGAIAYAASGDRNRRRRLSARAHRIQPGNTGYSPPGVPPYQTAGRRYRRHHGASRSLLSSRQHERLSAQQQLTSHAAPLGRSLRHTLDRHAPRLAAVQAVPSERLSRPLRRI